MNFLGLITIFIIIVFVIILALSLYSVMKNRQKLLDAQYEQYMRPLRFEHSKMLSGIIGGTKIALAQMAAIEKIDKRQRKTNKQQNRRFLIQKIIYSKNKRNKVKITKIYKHDLFNSNLTWLVRATYESEHFIIAVGDENINIVEIAVSKAIKCLKKSEAKRACNLFIKRTVK